MSGTQASEPGTPPPDELVEAPPEHRRRTLRQARHEAKAKLHVLAGDGEGLEDADLVCPQPPHDLGRKASPPPRRQPKPGRRRGFKVWKTPFWKRRRSLWAQRNAAERRLAEED